MVNHVGGGSLPGAESCPTRELRRPGGRGSCRAAGAECLARSVHPCTGEAGSAGASPSLRTSTVAARSLVQSFREAAVEVRLALGGISMKPIRCPACGHRPLSESGVCPKCGHTLEPRNVVPDGKLPPDLLAWARQTFNEEEFMEEVREIRETGGVRFEDFIGEIEARVRKGD